MRHGPNRESGDDTDRRPWNLHVAAMHLRGADADGAYAALNMSKWFIHKKRDGFDGCRNRSKNVGHAALADVTRRSAVEVQPDEIGTQLTDRLCVIGGCDAADLDANRHALIVTWGTASRALACGSRGLPSWQ